MRIGIDIGTHEMRAVLFDEQGTHVSFVSRALDVRGRRQQLATLDFGRTWNNLLQLLAELCAGMTDATIGVVGVSATASTIAVVDSSGNPTTRGLLWTNTAASGQVAYVESVSAELLSRTLGRTSGDRGIPKFLQLVRAGELEIRDAARVVELSEWIAWKLSGSLVADVALRQWGWSADDDGHIPIELMERLGVSQYSSYLDRPVASTGDVIGHIAGPVAKAIPALHSAKVLVGGMDSYQAALGQGVADPHRACASFGSSSSMVLSASVGSVVQGMYGPLTGLLPDSDCWHGGQASAGIAVDWAVSVLGRPRLELEAAASAVSSGAGGVLFRETLGGRRTPNPDPEVTGTWHGLALAHGASHLYRAVLEGVAMGARLSLEKAEFDELVVGGGLATSALYLRILADVMQRPLVLLREYHVAALGAAFADRSGDLPALNAVTERIHPGAPVYEEPFEGYRQLQFGGF